jgi:hypothetical protein
MAMEQSQSLYVSWQPAASSANRIQILWVHRQLAMEILSGQRSLDIVPVVPADAVLVAVGYRYDIDMVGLKLRHWSFEEVSEAVRFPTIEPIYGEPPIIKRLDGMRLMLNTLGEDRAQAYMIEELHKGLAEQILDLYRSK